MSPGGTPRVSVVVPHLDDLEGLAVTLDALARQVRPPDEVVVADNGSAGGTSAAERVATHFPRLPVRVVAAKVRGAGPARNAAVAAATGDVLAFLDCDCRPGPRWIADGLAALARAPVVGGPVRVTSEGEDDPVAAFDRLFGFDVARSFARHGHLLTCNLLVARRAFEGAGPFRDGVSEDVEWCHRAAARGFPLRFEPALAVEHRALASLDLLERRWRRITRETWAYHRERGLGRGRWALYLALVAFSVPVHAVRVLRAPDVRGWRLKARTVLTLARIRGIRAGLGVRLMWQRGGGEPRGVPERP
jgi:GT2 family glycosyltransferase